MKLLIGSDHAGYDLKEIIKKKFPEIEWDDHGTLDKESTPYPKYAQSVCEEIVLRTPREQLTEPKGILICGSGVGMSMQANRYVGIRAALCWNEEVAKLSRQHNAANVLCLGARFVDAESAVKMVKIWMTTPFEGGRHAERIAMLDPDCECC